MLLLPLMGRLMGAVVGEGRRILMRCPEGGEAVLILFHGTKGGGGRLDHVNVFLGFTRCYWGRTGVVGVGWE